MTTPDPNIEFYDCNAESYAAATRLLDVSAARGRFIRLLPPGGAVLDLGCGAGRDAAAFLASGLAVTAAEPSAGLAAIAGRATGLEILRVRAQEIDFDGRFDGVWASASLLHVPAGEMSGVFARIRFALKDGGVLYCSFKESEADFSDDHGRLFTGATHARIAAWASEAGGGLCVVDIWTAEDAMGRAGVNWLNAILRRE